MRRWSEGRLGLAIGYVILACLVLSDHTTRARSDEEIVNDVEKHLNSMVNSFRDIYNKSQALYPSEESRNYIPPEPEDTAWLANSDMKRLVDAKIFPLRRASPSGLQTRSIECGPDPQCETLNQAFDVANKITQEIGSNIIYEVQVTNMTQADNNVTDIDDNPNEPLLLSIHSHPESFKQAIDTLSSDQDVVSTKSDGLHKKQTAIIATSVVVSVLVVAVIGLVVALVILRNKSKKAASRATVGATAAMGGEGMQELSPDASDENQIAPVTNEGGTDNPLYVDDEKPIPLTTFSAAPLGQPATAKPENQQHSPHQVNETPTDTPASPGIDYYRREAQKSHFEEDPDKLMKTQVRTLGGGYQPVAQSKPEPSVPHKERFEDSRYGGPPGRSRESRYGDPPPRPRPSSSRYGEPPRRPPSGSRYQDRSPPRHSTRYGEPPRPRSVPRDDPPPRGRPSSRYGKPSEYRHSPSRHDDPSRPQEQRPDPPRDRYSENRERISKSLYQQERRPQSGGYDSPPKRSSSTKAPSRERSDIRGPYGPEDLY